MQGHEAVERAQTLETDTRGQSLVLAHWLCHFEQVASLSGPRCPQLQNGENKALLQRYMACRALRCLVWCSVNNSVNVTTRHREILRAAPSNVITTAVAVPLCCRCSSREPSSLPPSNPRLSGLPGLAIPGGRGGRLSGRSPVGRTEGD